MLSETLRLSMPVHKGTPPVGSPHGEGDKYLSTYCIDVTRTATTTPKPAIVRADGSGIMRLKLLICPGPVPKKLAGGSITASGNCWSNNALTGIPKNAVSGQGTKDRLIGLVVKPSLCGQGEWITECKGALKEDNVVDDEFCTVARGVLASNASSEVPFTATYMVIVTWPGPAPTKPAASAGVPIMVNCPPLRTSSSILTNTPVPPLFALR